MRAISATPPTTTPAIVPELIFLGAVTVPDADAEEALAVAAGEALELEAAEVELGPELDPDFAGALVDAGVFVLGSALVCGEVVVVVEEEEEEEEVSEVSVEVGVPVDVHKPDESRGIVPAATVSARLVEF